MARRVTCPSCGAKNEASAKRCRICTRTLNSDASPTERAFDAALYAESVSDRHREPLQAKYVLALLIMVVVGVNYAYLGYGPSWAHHERAEPAGTSWKTHTGIPGIVAVLPGQPTVTPLATTAGSGERYEVWVDDHWDAVRDQTTLSADAEKRALADQVAIIDVVRFDSGADPNVVILETVQAVQPGARLDGFEPSGPAPDGAAVVATARGTYGGMPEERSSGTVVATLRQENGILYGTIVWSAGDAVNQQMLDKLNNNLSLAS